jgi:APA family basic amino acid/polyamine antiporter
MAGEVEVGFIVAKSVFGELGGRFTGLVLASLLISTVSAMMIAGPRVLQVIGEDFKALRFLAKTNSDAIPSRAIYVQATLAIIFILSSGFESVLVFAGFTLALNSFATVIGVFVLRWQQPDLARPYKTFWYPIPPLIYMSLTGWTLDEQAGRRLVRNRRYRIRFAGLFLLAQKKYQPIGRCDGY